LSIWRVGRLLRLHLILSILYLCFHLCLVYFLYVTANLFSNCCFLIFYSVCFLHASLKYPKLSLHVNYKTYNSHAPFERNFIYLSFAYILHVSHTTMFVFLYVLLNIIDKNIARFSVMTFVFYTSNIVNLVFDLGYNFCMRNQNIWPYKICTIWFGLILYM
jgi:hypothetical protein